MRTERAAWEANENQGGPVTDDRGQAMPQLLTLAEVASLLKLNERTVRRMVATRRLPCVRIGRQLRFAPRVLSRWLQAREEG
jgi:excisionase family DNA binding protein